MPRRSPFLYGIRIGNPMEGEIPHRCRTAYLLPCTLTLRFAFFKYGNGETNSNSLDTSKKRLSKFRCSLPIISRIRSSALWGIRCMFRNILRFRLYHRPVSKSTPVKSPGCSSYLNGTRRYVPKRFLIRSGLLSWYSSSTMLVIFCCDTDSL